VFEFKQNYQLPVPQLSFALGISTSAGTHDFKAAPQLSDKLLLIDAVVRKKKPWSCREKNLAWIFRAHNIIKYRSPREHTTFADYNQLHGCTRFYTVEEKIAPAKVTATLIATRHPHQLFAGLRKRYGVTRREAGIYEVTGELYPTQIIVARELSAPDNLWLTNLRKN
jgi:hypothetical protein